MGELLPLKIKNFAFSACFALNTLFQFLMTSTWNSSLANLGYVNAVSWISTIDNTSSKL
jgi:hypothetical protein